MNKYLHIKELHEAEFSAFPMMFFAFSEEQFTEGLAKLGVPAEKVCRTYANCYIRRKDKWRLLGLLDRHTAEMELFLADDANLIAAINFELGNHEYCITYDPRDTVEILGLDLNDARTVRCFNAAKRQYLNDARENGWY